MSTPTKNLSIAEVAEATNVWYKLQRVLRTAVATLISALSVWAGFSAIWPDVAAQLARILPGEAMAWLAGTVVSITLVASVITRIMAIPVVNAFLTKWLGLGSVPKSALVDPVEYTGMAPFTEDELNTSLDFDDMGKLRHPDGTYATDREAAAHIWGKRDEALPRLVVAAPDNSIGTIPAPVEEVDPRG